MVHRPLCLPPRPVRAMAFVPALAALVFAGGSLKAAAPVLDDLLPAAGEAPRVTPAVPVGKTLLFPVTASDADGDALSYSVKSSNPRILVRAKTGNPLLKLEIEHAAGATDDPAYAGDLVLMLFRDWLPITSGYVTGMAAAGYYDNLIFHRLTDLGGGAGTTGFIFQGGDPLGTGGGGPGIVGTDPASSWKFANEFHVGTIFSGRGQLAMANAGTQTSYTLGSGGSVIAPDYTDTNGSQFFLTDGQPRHLDFNHNIFGQLLRGWDLVPKLKATKVTDSKPAVNVTIKKATVLPNLTDAVLVISAKARGSAVITVTVSDPGGGQSVKTFTVHAVPDTTNDQPFLLKLDPVSTPKNTPAIFGIRGVDLEFDYLDYQHSPLPALGESAHGTLLAQSGTVAGFQPETGYTGRVNVGFAIRQYDIGPGGFNPVSDYTNCWLGVGDRGVRAEPVTIEGTPAAPLTALTVGKIDDLDPAGAPGNFTATINWGDGTKIEAASISRSGGAPGSNTYAASGTHVYGKAGVYPVVTEFLGNNGARGTVRSTALIRTGPIRAVGEKIDLNSARVVNRMVATFTDTASTRHAADYAAEVDWGDGLVSPGVVAFDTRSNLFTVRGTHGYMDSEPFAVRVRVWKKTAPAASSEAWTTIHPRFAAAPHLPPFPHPKLTIAWNSGPTKSAVGAPGPDYQVTYSGTFVVINTGNRPVGNSKLRFWLSEDKIVNAIGPNKDIVVPVNKVPLLNIIGFDAGGGGSGNFTLRLPKGDSGGHKYLLSETVYSDPIANDDGSAKVIVTGPLQPTIRVNPVSGLTTTEAGGTATFTVVLDTPPETATVPIAQIVAGNPATIHTAGAHGFDTGTPATLSGIVGATPALNGTHLITKVDADTFTIPVVLTAYDSGARVLRFTDPDSSAVVVTGVVAGNPATIHTATPNGYANGDQVFLWNLIGVTPDIAGLTTVTVVDADTFTIPRAVTSVQPKAQIQPKVTFPLESSVLTEGTVSPAQLVFTPENWSVPQTVTITGVDDTADDGNKAYKITIKAAASADTLYNGLAGGEVNVTNTDDDPTPP